MPHQIPEGLEGSALTDLDQAITQVKDSLAEADKFAGRITDGDFSPNTHGLLSFHNRRLFLAGYAIKMKMIEAERLLKHKRVELSAYFMSDAYIVESLGKPLAKTPADQKAKDDTIDEQAYIDRLDNNHELLTGFAKLYNESLQMARVAMAKTDVSPRGDMASI